MVYDSNRTMQRDKLFSMINFIATPMIDKSISCSFKWKKLNIDLFYDTKMLTKNERNKLIAMNMKAQAIICTHIC